MISAPAGRFSPLGLFACLAGKGQKDIFEIWLIGADIPYRNIGGGELCQNCAGMGVVGIKADTHIILRYYRI